MTLATIKPRVAHFISLKYVCLIIAFVRCYQTFASRYEISFWCVAVPNKKKKQKKKDILIDYYLKLSIFFH